MTSYHIIRQQGLDDVEIADETGEVKRCISHEVSRINIVFKYRFAASDEFNFTGEDRVVDECVTDLLVFVVSLEN